MPPSERGGLAALEICEEFGARASGPTIVSAFHELVAEVAVLRERTIRDVDLSAETIQRSEHLWAMSKLIRGDLEAGTLPHQETMQAQLFVTMAWLQATPPA
jgi:hypothetical protein